MPHTSLPMRPPSADAAADLLAKMFTAADTFREELGRPDGGTATAWLALLISDAWALCSLVGAGITRSDIDDLAGRLWMVGVPA
jgi:hypothetical protein